MTKEDLDFLKELQHELLTQDNDGQAAPRFWGIRERKERITKDFYGDDMYVIDSTDGEPQKYSLDEYVEVLKVAIDEEEEPAYEVIDGFAFLDTGDIDDVVDFANNVMDRNAMASSFETYEELSDQTGCFLTKRAAKKHIELNGYHYQNPHTYAMTAWRNPEFEKFLKIFENLDLTKLEILVSNDDAEQQQDTGSR